MALFVPNETRFEKETEIVRLRPFSSIGDLEVSVGSQVGPDSLIGTYASRRRLRHVRIETSSDGLLATVLVQEGQKVNRGEVLAYYSYFFGLGYTEYVSPCDGEVIGISPSAGTISIREAPVKLHSHLSGVVVRTDDALGAWVKTYGDLLKGAFGAGYGRSGKLSVKASTPGATVSTRDIGADDAGKILIVGRTVSQEVLEASLRYRVAGVVAGSASHRVWTWYDELAKSLDWDEFLAKYWARDAKKKEAAPVPTEISPALVLTEGLGDLPPETELYEALIERDGQTAYIDGGGDGSNEPALVVPKNGGVVPDGWTARPSAPLGEIAPGMRVRAFGLQKPVRYGTVVELLPEGETENGFAVPVAIVVDEDGKRATVPLSNIVAGG